jgi:hypothetical protein
MSFQLESRTFLRLARLQIFLITRCYSYFRYWVIIRCSSCFIFRNQCKYVLTINSISSIRTGTEYLNLSQLVCIRCSYFYVVIYQVDTTETRAPLAPSQNRQPESVNSISNSVTPTEHKPLSYTV